MTERRTGAWVSPLVTTLLATAAAGSMIFGVTLALGREDNEVLESPLLLTITHQLIHGPWQLYGPFGGDNPWVLIHAPLYYRLSALIGWPLVRAGVDPVTAAMAAGRLLSFIGLWSTVAAAYRMAQLDGAPRRVGLWAALLIASSPVVGVMPYAVRPDMLGVALHTTGVLLVLTVLRDQRARPARLLAAYAAFGFAVCIKQHFIVGPLVSAFLLLSACARRRLASRVVVAGFLTGLAIVLFGYVTEELVSEGRMSRAVFQAAASSTEVHPVGWMRALIVVYGIVGKSSGLMFLFLAVSLADVGALPGIGRRALVVVGAGILIVFAVQTPLIDAFQMTLTRDDQLLIVSEFALTLFLLIPACWLISRRSQSVARLDWTLGLYLAAEVVLVLMLARASAGAWINYGIQVVVFASILCARALSRTCAAAPGFGASSLIALALFIVLIGVAMDTKQTADRRYEERLAAAAVIDHYGRPANEFFFVNRPGLNRLHGRLNLAYDNWLYPVFEAKHLAQPRSIWLRRALSSGEIQFVVNGSDIGAIAGVGETLPQLGYTRDIQVATIFYVWRNRFDPVPPRR